MPPIPPDIVGLFWFLIWIVIAIVVIFIVFYAVKNVLPRYQYRSVATSSYDNALEELLKEVRALKEEIRELRKELKE